MSDLFMGIDVGKSHCEICVIDDECTPIYCDQISTLNENEWTEMLCLFEGHSVHAVFEVGPQYEWMYDFLSGYCTQVEVVNALAFSIISKSQKKTDKIDALKLAEGIWRNDLPTVYVPIKHIRKDRRLVSHLHSLSQTLTMVKTQIQSMLFVNKFACPFTEIEGIKANSWLVAAVLPKLDDQDQVLLGCLIEQLKLLTTQQRHLEKVAFERTKSYEHSEIVQSIPGFGPLVSLSILCAIADNTRFESPDQLSSYFGLCGRISQSGGALYQGRITKRGNNHVRWLLGQAITTLIRRDARARARYLKLKRKKRAKVARVALMRWITVVLWHMLAKKEKFNLNGVRGKHYARKVWVKKAA